MPETLLFRILTNEVNNYSFNGEAFAANIVSLHPTVQQLFFNLVRTCILFMAEEGNVSIDDRNRASFEMCREIAEQVRNSCLPCR